MTKSGNHFRLTFVIINQAGVFVIFKGVACQLLIQKLEKRKETSLWLLCEGTEPFAFLHTIINKFATSNVAILSANVLD